MGDPKLQYLLKYALVEVHLPHDLRVDRQGSDHQFPFDTLAGHYEAEQLRF